jgi:hypothetical protein
MLYEMIPAYLEGMIPAYLEGVGSATPDEPRCLPGPQLSGCGLRGNPIPLNGSGW